VARWGLAALVACGAAAAAWVAWRAAVPPEIPAFALQAAPVYRVEVGAAVFAAAYLGSTALVLALDNRAFSDISTSGFRAQAIIETQDRGLFKQRRRVERLIEDLESLNADLRSTSATARVIDDD
jgi:hypothetical protein